MPYRPRPIRFIKHVEHAAWRLKLYGISAWADTPPRDLLDVAEHKIGETLALASDGHHGVGFAGAHDGKMASFVFVSWWAKTYELNHVLYRSPRGEYNKLARVEATLFGCTWDLEVIAFERRAWINAMLNDEGTPHLPTYLASTFNADL